jgi:hypothetical protein
VFSWVPEHRAVISRSWRAKAAALIATGGLAVHELRYGLGYGPGAHQAEAEQGHGYLVFVVPLVAAGAFLALVTLLARIGRAGGAPHDVAMPRLRSLWVASSACLIALYMIQESTEGALAPGHPGGLVAFIGHGGWTAFPLAVVIGAAIAVALRGAHGGGCALPADPRTVSVTVPGIIRVAPSAPMATRRDELARHLAGRGPPLIST